MSVVCVSDIRVAPIGEDLTTEDLSLSVLRGLENMYRVDKKVASGATFLKGEWAVLDSDGKASRPTATPVGHTYLVFCGTDRFDSKATGQVTLIMGKSVIVKTSRFDDGQSYAVGDYLTVKDLGGGEAYVTKAGGAEPRLGAVLEVGTGYLVFETLGGFAS
jgi:hypothetical protein